MIIKRGIGISIGISMGNAFIMKEENIVIEKKTVVKEKIKEEVNRYKLALAKTKNELDIIQTQVLNALGRQHARLIDAHSMILKDPLITKDVIDLIISNKYNAEYALSVKVEEILKKFEKITDSFFAERKNEILDVSRRIILNLTNTTRDFLKNLNSPTILIANNIYPSDLLNIRKSSHIVGICMNIGSKTSHSALFIQNMGIPSIVGLGDITKIVKEGDFVIVNGEDGNVIIDPTPEIIESYKKKKEQLHKNEKYLSKIKKLATVTRDNRKINLMVNIDNDRDIEEYKQSGADGIGLFRTEFLYIDSKEIPSEQKHVEVYKKVLKATPDLPVVIRTADIGADKVSNIAIKETNETNPFMGFRGIRLFLRYPELLKTQLRAIYCASNEGNVSIMLPMITSVDEILQVKTIINDVQKELSLKNIPYKKDVPLGVMIEVPSAAIVVDQILDLVDFISVGTNDLIQYLLAVDRINQYVSSMYDPFHPAVLRILNLIVQTAHKKGKKVSVCGEMAQDPYGMMVLIALGVDILSVPLKGFLKAKQHIRAQSYERLSSISLDILNMNNSQDIIKLLENEMIYEH